MTTTPVPNRSVASRVTFYGHSFCSGFTPTSTSGLTMAGLRAPWRSDGVGGATLSQMITRAARRAHPYGLIAPLSALVIIAGANDLADSIGRTGLQVHTDIVTLATNWKAAANNGPVIVANVPAAAGIVTNEAERVDANTRIVVAGNIDYVANLAGSAALAADIASGDGTHPFTQAGRQLIADLIRPHLVTAGIT